MPPFTSLNPTGVSIAAGEGAHSRDGMIRWPLHTVDASTRRWSPFHGRQSYRVAGARRRAACGMGHRRAVIAQKQLRAAGVRNVASLSRRYCRKETALGYSSLGDACDGFEDRLRVVVVEVREHLSRMLCGRKLHCLLHVVCCAACRMLAAFALLPACLPACCTVPFVHSAPTSSDGILAALSV